jgi:hypothetical protein
VAALGDGAIMLARIGHTKTKPLRAALQRLEAANAGLLGTVVTCEPGHGRDLPKPGQPASAPAPANLVAPKSDAAAAREADTTTNQAGAHRMSGAKREGL